MTKPPTLKDRALVVRVSIPRWDPKRADKRGAPIIAKATNGHADTGQWLKWRVPKSEVDPIRKAADTARTFNYAQTLPWQDGGFRLLSVAMFDEYMDKIGEHRQTFLDAVAVFLKRYPRLVTQAADKLGTLYDPAEYPTLEELTARYDFRVKVSEIGDEPDIRSDLIKPEMLEQLRADMRRDIEASANAAQRELWSRMFEVAKRISETLTDEDKTFRDSLVTRSDEILTRLGPLNVFSNPEVERVRAELHGLLLNEDGRPINPDRFRYHAAKQPGGARVVAAEKASATMREVAGILDKFGI